MIEAPIALAFAAGMVATLNPCGFAMLPAYLSYFMGLDGDEPRSRTATIGSAFGVGGIVSLGFLVVFGLAGLLISTGFRTVIDWIPWLALLIGVAVGGLGVALLCGFEPNVSLLRAPRGKKGRDLRSVFMFGVSYAVASLSCTLPVFLTVVAGQVTQANLISGFLTFVVYGMGMALVLLALTVALALGKASLVRRFRRAMKHMNLVSGVILMTAGLYIVWFWGTSLISGPAGLDSAVFRFVEDLSQTALNFVSDNTGAVAVAMTALLAVAGLLAVRGNPRMSRHDADDVEKIDSLR